MAESLIECPECGHEFSVADALSSEIEEKFKKKFLKDISKKDAEIEKIQADLENEKKTLAKKQIELDKTVQEKLAFEKVDLEKKLRASIVEQSKLEFEDLKTQVQEKSKQIAEAQKMELELRKKSRDLEEKEKSLELELQRKFDAEKTKIEEDVAKRIVEDQRLKGAEKDKQLDDMRKQIEDLKRKAEQGSQQSQGEVLELEIEASLKALFITDQIEPVAKGMKGGDLIQKVFNSLGQHAGTIIWETKRTKSWSDGWVEKLKEDQRAISAEFAVIVTQVMPKDVNNLGQINGVWVVDYRTYHGIAIALRSNLIQLFQARSAVAGKGEKMDFLYNYLTGTQFKQRVEAIVEAFRSMQIDLDKEKRVIQKNWSAREQQISKVLISTVGMYGDVQGIVGASLPKIAALEFEGTDEDKESSDDK